MGKIITGGTRWDMHFINNNHRGRPGLTLIKNPLRIPIQRDSPFEVILEPERRRRYLNSVNARLLALVRDDCNSLSHSTDGGTDGRVVSREKEIIVCRQTDRGGEGEIDLALHCLSCSSCSGGGDREKEE